MRLSGVDELLKIGESRERRVDTPGLELSDCLRGVEVRGPDGGEDGGHFSWVGRNRLAGLCVVLVTIVYQPDWVVDRYNIHDDGVVSLLERAVVAQCGALRERQLAGRADVALEHDSERVDELRKGRSRLRRGLGRASPVPTCRSSGGS